MESRTLSKKSQAEMLKGCPRAKWGLLSSDGITAKAAGRFEERHELGPAGMAYVAAGKHSAALRTVRKLLAEQENGKGGESNFLKAARIIIALHKATRNQGWAQCAKRMADKAQEAEKHEEAAQILEEAGFSHEAELARKDLRLSVWAETVTPK